MCDENKNLQEIKKVKENKGIISNGNNCFNQQTTVSVNITVNGDREEIKEYSEVKVLPEEKSDGAIYLAENVVNKIKGSVNNLSLEKDTDVGVSYEHQAEVDHAKKLIENHNYEQALDYLLNLKTRIFQTASANIKFRILSNIGASYLGLIGRGTEAAENFLEALQYNPTDEKAKCNAALGKILLDQKTEAREILDEVLKINQGSVRALALKLQTIINIKELQDYISKIPEQLKSKTDISMMIGIMYSEFGDLATSRIWLEKVINNEDITPQAKAKYAEIILQINLKDNYFAIQSKQIKIEVENDLKLVVKYFSEAIKEIENTDLYKIRMDWINNMGVAKGILGNFDEAKIDFEKVDLLAPDDVMFLRNRALVYFEQENYGESKKYLEKIIKLEKEPDSSYQMYAELLVKEKRVDEAIKVLLKVIEKSNSSQLIENSKRQLIQIYISDNNLESAQKLNDELRSQDPENIFFLIDAASIEKAKNNIKSSLSYLLEAEKYVSDDVGKDKILALADSFYFAKDYRRAAKLYEIILTLANDTNQTYRYLISLYKTGQYQKALDLCKRLRDRLIFLKYAVEIEAAIYEEIGDLEGAKNVCKDYLNRKDDYEIKLRLALINFQLDNFKELDEFLGEKIPEDIDLQSGFQIVFLLAQRGLKKKSFEIAYDLREKFFDNPEAHSNYIAFFLQNESGNESILGADEVEIGATAILKDELGKEFIYTIVEKNPNKARNEITKDEDLGKVLLGKRVGEEFKINIGLMSEEKRFVKEIKSKFVNAFQETLLFNEKFPGTIKGFQSIKVSLSPEKEELDENFKNKFLKTLEQRSEYCLEIENLYNKGKITIGAFAVLIGRNIFELWSGLCNRPGVGIKCANGDLQERSNSYTLFDNEIKLIIDPISLMTIFQLDVQDKIVKEFGKLGIAQSTINLLKTDLLEMKNGIKSKGYSVASKEGEQGSMIEISEEQIKKNSEKIEKIVEWIKENCEVISSPGDLSENKKREKLSKILGKESLDTVLICTQPNNFVLFSDDERLRNLAKTEFGIEGVWSQIILSKLKDQGAIKEEEFQNYVVKLINLNYHYIFIDSPTLVEAAKISDWKAEKTFEKTLSIIENDKSDILSAINVATGFFYLLWKEPILPEYRNKLIDCTLKYLFKNRDYKNVFKGLKEINKKLFRFMPLAEANLNEIIENWIKVNIN